MQPSENPPQLVATSRPSRADEGILKLRKANQQREIIQLQLQQQSGADAIGPPAGLQNEDPRLRQLRKLMQEQEALRQRRDEKAHELYLRMAGEQPVDRRPEFSAEPPQQAYYSPAEAPNRRKPREQLISKPRVVNARRGAPPAGLTEVGASPPQRQGKEVQPAPPPQLDQRPLERPSRHVRKESLPLPMPPRPPPGTSKTAGGAQYHTNPALLPLQNPAYFTQPQVLHETSPNRNVSTPDQLRRAMARLQDAEDEIKRANAIKEQALRGLMAAKRNACRSYLRQHSRTDEILFSYVAVVQSFARALLPYVPAMKAKRLAEIEEAEELACLQAALHASESLLGVRRSKDNRNRYSRDVDSAVSLANSSRNQQEPGDGEALGSREGDVASPEEAQLGEELFSKRIRPPADELSQYAESSARVTPENEFSDTQARKPFQLLEDEVVYGRHLAESLASPADPPPRHVTSNFVEPKAYKQTIPEPIRDDGEEDVVIQEPDFTEEATGVFANDNGPLFNRENEAATKIQAVQRGRHARGQYQETKQKRTAAATRIQSVQRGISGRAEAQQRRDELIEQRDLLEAEAERLEAEWNGKDLSMSSSSKLPTFSEFVAIDETSLPKTSQEIAATKIQCAQRCRVARHDVAKLRSARAAQMSQWHEDEQRQLSAIKIQSLYRGHKVRATLHSARNTDDEGGDDEGEPNDEEEEPQNEEEEENDYDDEPPPELTDAEIRVLMASTQQEARAAIKIQRMERGRQARSQTRKIRQRRTVENGAATKIQSVQRGRMVRKEVNAMRATEKGEWQPIPLSPRAQRIPACFDEAAANEVRTLIAGKVWVDPETQEAPEGTLWLYPPSVQHFIDAAAQRKPKRDEVNGEFGCLLNTHPCWIQHGTDTDDTSSQQSDQVSPSNASNYSSSTVMFPSAEHYFHGLKFELTAPEVLLQIAQTPSVIEMRRIVRQNQGLVRQDWTEIREAVMFDVVLAKFRQHEILREILCLRTSELVVVLHDENDAYWGDGGDGSGENLFGIVLMTVRAALKRAGTF